MWLVRLPPPASGVLIILIVAMGAFFQSHTSFLNREEIAKVSGVDVFWLGEASFLTQPSTVAPPLQQHALFKYRVDMCVSRGPKTQNLLKGTALRFISLIGCLCVCVCVYVCVCCVMCVVHVLCSCAHRPM